VDRRRRATPREHDGAVAIGARTTGSRAAIDG
jgi:hypothetical protein